MKRDREKTKKRSDDDAPKKTKKQREYDKIKEQWGGDEDDEEKEDNTFKPKTGKNSLRVMPPKDPEGRFYEAWAIHWNLGPDKKQSTKCTEPGGPFGHNKKLDAKRGYKAKKCVVCRVYCKNKTKSMKFKFGSPQGKRFWQENVAPFRAKHSYVMAVNTPKSKAKRNKVQIYKCGVMVGKPLIDAYYDEDGVDFTNPETGNLIKLTKVELGGGENNVEYKVQILPAQTTLANWKRLKKQLPDLESHVPEDPTPEEQIAVMEGDSDDDDDLPMPKKRKRRDDDDADDDDSDDEDDDDDDDEGSSRKHKLAKRRRREDEDVDPDEEEIDDEDEDEDADLDEDDTPRSMRKRKKSKTRAKLSRKARRDEDDDDDEEDDEAEDEDDDDEGDDDDEDSDEDLDDEDDE